MKGTLLLFLIGGCGGLAMAESFAPATVSLAGLPSISGSGHSFAPLLSADHRYILFLSSAKNLVTGDPAERSNNPGFPSNAWQRRRERSFELTINFLKRAVDRLCQ
jgi:hypothetical protein